MELGDLVGKTIVSAKYKRLSDYSDTFAELKFSDWSEIIIQGSFGGYDGDSVGEFSTSILLRDAKELENLYESKLVDEDISE